MDGGQFEQSWNQQHGETSLWYVRFLVYLDMGLARTFVGGYTKWLREAGDYTKADKSRSVPGQWQIKAKEFSWFDRAQAFDINERHQRKARDDQRLQELRNEEYNLGLAMLREAQRMIDWPLVEKTVVEDDGTTNTFKPAAWTKGTAERYLKTASEVCRRAVGVGLDGEVKGAIGSDGEQRDDYQRDLDDIGWLVEAMPERIELAAAQESADTKEG